MEHFINWIIALLIFDCALVLVRTCVCYWDDWSAAIKNQIKKWRKKRNG